MPYQITGVAKPYQITAGIGHAVQCCGRAEQSMQQAENMAKRAKNNKIGVFLHLKHCQNSTEKNRPFLVSSAHCQQVPNRHCKLLSTLVNFGETV